MKRPLRQSGFGALGLIVVAATITLAGFVAFRYLAVTDNTEVASNSTPASQQHQSAQTVAAVNSAHDVDTVIHQLDAVPVDSMDGADLDAELNF